MSALADLEKLYADLRDDPDLESRPSIWRITWAALHHFTRRRVCLMRLVAVGFFSSARISTTPAPGVNNTIGQALLAKHMGKKRVIAENGAGQHGVASATVAARLGLECHVFMGEEDIRRQALNVYRMKLPAASGIRHLRFQKLKKTP